MEWRNERESRAREQSEGANAVRTKHFPCGTVLLSCDRDVKLCQKGLYTVRKNAIQGRGGGCV